MNKYIQKQHNDLCEVAVAQCTNPGTIIAQKRLRTCQAVVYETADLFILQSYSTIVACIDRNANILYDFSRLVYGYTAITTQHIAKFNHDYCAGNWGCDTRYTWRYVG